MKELNENFAEVLKLLVAIHRKMASLLIFREFFQKTILLG